MIKQGSGKIPAPGPVLDCAGLQIDLSRPCVMGVLNVTPDSFSDGGRHNSLEAALARAQELVVQGADIIDLGGESTRPGAQPVGVDEELRRTIPVIKALAGVLPIPVSIDTRKPEVMQAAIAAGASLVNDVNALRAPGALDVVADSKAAVCLMHMQGEPGIMQEKPRYADVVEEVLDFLRGRIEACEVAGIGRHRLLVDPGFGFGKTLEHNLALLNGLHRFESLGVPILVGLSRKSMIGTLLDVDVDQRLNGSIVLAAIACLRGASVVRAHDVAETAQAMQLCAAVLGAAVDR